MQKMMFVKNALRGHIFNTGLCYGFIAFPHQRFFVQTQQWRLL